MEYAYTVGDERGGKKDGKNAIKRPFSPLSVLSPPLPRRLMMSSKAAVRALQRGDVSAANALLEPLGGWSASLTKNNDTPLHLAAAFAQPKVLQYAIGEEREREEDG